MIGIVKSQLTGLAGTMTELQERVRVAVAGELGRAVGDAVRQVVQAVVAERAEPVPPRRPPTARWAEDDEDERDGWGRPRDPWADRDDDDGYERGRGYRTAPARAEPPPVAPPPATASAATAVAAGVFVARWWLVRRGTLLAATGLGVGVGLLGVVGGPLARTAVALLAATADVLTATDALGGGAARLADI